MYKDIRNSIISIDCKDSTKEITYCIQNIIYPWDLIKSGHLWHVHFDHTLPRWGSVHTTPSKNLKISFVLILHKVYFPLPFFTSLTHIFDCWSDRIGKPRSARQEAAGGGQAGGGVRRTLGNVLPRAEGGRGRSKISSPFSRGRWVSSPAPPAVAPRRRRRVDANIA